MFKATVQNPFTRVVVNLREYAKQEAIKQATEANVAKGETVECTVVRGDHLFGVFTFAMP